MLIINKPKMLIFDWDGTLCDSLQRIALCLRMSATDVGLPVPSFEAAKNIVGLGLDEVMIELFPDADLTTQAQLRQRYSEHFIREDAQPSPFFPGVRAHLETLRDEGYIMAVATGKSRRGLDRVLGGLDMKGFFHSTRCADETASKPDPHMLLSLLEEFATLPQAALMVGDTSYDMAMARAANTPRLAVSYGAHSQVRLASYEPVACIEKFEDINHILAQCSWLNEGGGSQAG